MIDDNFRCDAIAMTRAIKDEISAELNAMTQEERHLYFERINAEARDYFEMRKQAKLREREKKMTDDNFRCDTIAMTRVIKDKISAELNAKPCDLFTFLQLGVYI